MNTAITQGLVKRYLTLLLLVFFLCNRCLGADSYSCDFTGELYIWDISGSYTDSAMGCTVSYVMTQDAKGKITGYGTASCSIMGVDIDMSYNIKGSVGQKNNVATLKVNIKFLGTASYLGETYKFSASEKITAEINATTQTMSGILKVCAAIPALRYRECDTIGYSAEVPPDMDGSSSLQFDVTEDGNKLLGSGTLTLSNGGVFVFSVKGKYNPKKDLSIFKLKGDTSSKGCKLNIKIDESTDLITSLKGKALGQKITATGLDVSKLKSSN